MSETEIYAQLRAIQETLQGMNNTLGALKTAMHLPGDCELKAVVNGLKAAENKRMGALKVIIPLATLGSGVLVAVITKLLAG